MTPDQMQGFMLKLAEASKSGSVHNQVFVYRKVLTEVHQCGHDDGMRAARNDDFVRSEIEQGTKEANDG